MNGAFFLGLNRWIDLATSSLPVPLAPCNRTLQSTMAIFLIMLKISCMAALVPMNPFENIIPRDGFPQTAILLPQGQLLAGAGGQHAYFLQFEGLGDIVIGAFLDGCDGRVDGTMSRDDDDFGLVMPGFSGGRGSPCRSYPEG